MHKKTIELDNWRLWCRLCAKEDPTGNVSVFFKDEEETNEGCSGAAEVEGNNFGNNSRDLALASAIEKYFWINITRMEELPKMLCTECFTLVTSLVNFTERISKVQQMFFALLETENCVNVDLHGIRMKYGLLDEDREHVLVQTQPQPLPEVHYFEAKPKVNELEEKIFDDETITNPLEQRPRIRIKIKKEQILEKDVLQSEYNCFNEDNNDNAYDENENDNDPFTDDDNERDEDFIVSKAFDRGTDTESDDELNVFDKDDHKASDDKLDEITLNAKSSKVKKTGDFESRNSVAIKPQKKRRKHSKRINNSEVNKHDDYKEKDDKIKKEDDTEATFICSECPSKFKRLQNYRLHMKTKHLTLVPLPQISCPECPRVFTNQVQLDKHTKAHLPEELKKTCVCPYCDKKFRWNTLVRTHIRHVHMNERPFVCEECGVAVHTNAALKTHMLIHSDYAPFECEVCKKRFKERTRLNLHMETHNTDHKHICPECGQQLNSRVTLNRHLLVHSDKMQHKCDYCGREFKRAKALKNHLILHTGLKPFSCDFCDRTFADGSNCRSHKKKAHPEELAAQEAAGGAKPCTRNIPKLETLKAITKAADNLTPVASKQSGCFAFGKKPKTPLKLDTNKSAATTSSPSMATSTSAVTSTSMPKLTPAIAATSILNEHSTSTTNSIIDLNSVHQLHSAVPNTVLMGHQNTQVTSAVIPTFDIYNHIMKQATIAAQHSSAIEPYQAMHEE